MCGCSDATNGRSAESLTHFKYPRSFCYTFEKGYPIKLGKSLVFMP